MIGKTHSPELCHRHFNKNEAIEEWLQRRGVVCLQSQTSDVRVIP